jgi:hypothetical protein
MNTSLVGVSVVKNEADIIEANVRHNLRYLDRLIVLDHDSCDATSRILRFLVEEGLPLTLRRLPKAAPAFYQPQITHGLMREAFDQFGADFVFPIDADEFIRTPSRAALIAALRGTTACVASLPWQTYVPAVDGQGGHPLHALRWRIESANAAFGKVVVSRRIDANEWRIGRGNHVVYEQYGTDLSWTAGDALAGMALAHLPLRSPAQLISKALIGWLARKLSYGPKGETTTSSWHLRELFQRVVLTGEPITYADVHDYAIRLYAPGRMPEERRTSEDYRIVEDPFAESMPLRYTDSEPADPARLLALWTSQLIDRMLQSQAPTNTTEPANS